jgi:RNA polymerase sigma-70 factor (ECF subfamily)
MSVRPPDSQDNTADEQSSAVSIASSLLVRLKGQDNQSWQELHFLYSPIIGQWLRRARIEENDAADLEQEVFQSVWRKIGDFQRDGSGSTFRGWLWIITQNKIRDMFRRRNKAARGEGGTDALLRINRIATPDDDESSECPVPDDDENRELIRRAIQLVKRDVKPETWDAFWLTAVEGLSAADVGERLQLKVGTVYTARSRVLTRLREVLGSDAEAILKLG